MQILPDGSFRESTSEEKLEMLKLHFQETWYTGPKIAHIGVWKLELTHVYHEYLLVKTLQHHGIVTPKNAISMEQLILERSKELRINLGLEKTSTDVDDVGKYMMSDTEKEELGLG